MRLPLHLTGRTRWLLVANIALLALAGAVVLGPVRHVFGNTRSSLAGLQRETESLRARAEQLKPVTREERRELQQFWRELGEHLSLVRAGSSPELIREIAGLAETAGATPTGVRALGSRLDDDAPIETSLQLRAIEGTETLTLEPRKVQLELRGGVHAVSTTLMRLSELSRPLRVERISLERAGTEIRASFELTYFVRKEPS